MTSAFRDEGRPRFLTDEGFNMAITNGLRQHYPQMDLITLQEARLLHMSDPHLLMLAKQLNRVLLTHDSRTMPGHFYDLLGQLQPGEHDPGVLLIPQETAVGVAIRWIGEVWEASRHEEWRDAFTWLPL